MTYTSTNVSTVLCTLPTEYCTKVKMKGEVDHGGE